MKRDYLINLLNQYQPTDGGQQVYKKMMLDFAKAHENCFERSLQIGHFTASCWLLNKDHSKALLMHHAKLNRWFQLGGHCDGDSDILAVAIKEAQEESGIDTIEPISAEIFDIDVHLIPARKNEPAHYHYDVRFLLHVTTDQDVVQNRESKELRWIEKQKSALPTDEVSVTRMFEKWIQKEW